MKVAEHAEENIANDYRALSRDYRIRIIQAGLWHVLEGGQRRIKEEGISEERGQ